MSSIGMTPESDKPGEPPDGNPTLTDADRRALAAATITNSSRIGSIPPRREFLQALAAGFLGAFRSGGSEGGR